MKKPGSLRGPSSQRGFILTLLLILLVLGVLAVFGLGLYVLSLDQTVREKFEGKRWAIPAKVYARPLELYSGAPLALKDVLAELDILHYRPVTGTPGPGTYQQQGNTLFVATRGFNFSDGLEPAQVLRLRFQGGSLTDVASTQQQNRGVVRLEPLTIGGIYPKHNEDRVLMRLKEAPPHLIDALLATEDRAFYQHHGISVRGILRAVWVNLTAGQLRQGGSTITQQLVKNFYLTDERTLKRKLNEAAMALLLEWHYEKKEILETYLNEVYLGQSGKNSINGFGLAAQYYFGQPISELELHQVALIVGIVKGPSYYEPRRNPARARERRNIVLDNLFHEGFISAAQRDAAKAKALGVIASPSVAGIVYPDFMDVVRRQLKQEYREEDLASEGLRIFTTLDPRVQEAAKAAQRSALDRLRQGYGKRVAGIESAVVVAQPETGELLALLGGAQRFTGYNRALDARRQVGSLFKPAVYLSALSGGQYNLLSPLDDSPVELQSASGKLWTPTNYDNQSHGTVPLYDALAHSYNQATIRLGMTVGVPAVVDTLKRLGVKQELSPYPALLLGAAELSPFDVTQHYQVFAAGGFRAPLRSIREVVGAEGKALKRYALEIEQVYDPASIFLLNYALQQTMRSGTAASAYQRLPADLVMAGKTGTTNDLRDSWFAGYTGNYVAVVWLGHDNNRSTGLSGATGALPIWADLMARLHPLSLPDTLPENVEYFWADKASGLLSAETCEGAVLVPFRSDAVPQEMTPCAQGGLPAVIDSVGNAVNGTVDKVINFFKPGTP